MVLRVLRVIRTPLTLLILLGILCYGAWWGWTNIAAPPPEPAPVPCVDTKVSKNTLKSSQVTVRVFNGGDQKGLATEVTRALQAREFIVLEPTNTDQPIKETVIIGNSAKSPEVLFVQKFFKDATVKGDGRADHSVDIMVGNAYAGFNSKASTSYKVKTDTVCLPNTSASAPAES